MKKNMKEISSAVIKADAHTALREAMDREDKFATACAAVARAWLVGLVPDDTINHAAFESKRTDLLRYCDQHLGGDRRDLLRVWVRLSDETMPEGELKGTDTELLEKIERARVELHDLIRGQWHIYIYDSPGGNNEYEEDPVNEEVLWYIARKWTSEWSQMPWPNGVGEFEPD